MICVNLKGQLTSPHVSRAGLAFPELECRCGEGQGIWGSGFGNIS